MQGVPGTAWAWGFAVSSGAGFHAAGGQGGISVIKPATGVCCIVTSSKRGSHKAAQVTLADPGSARFVSVGTGHGSLCNPYIDATHDVVPVYIKAADGTTAVDANFTIVIP